jgi:hypothetical protein
VPRPTTLYKLWIFLHECYHAGYDDPFHRKHLAEYRAEEFALENIEAAGISVPLWLRVQSNCYIEALIKEDEAKGLFVDPGAAKYVGYRPKPYEFHQESVLTQIAEQTAELLKAPMLSEAEVRRIAAIRKEFSNES